MNPRKLVKLLGAGVFVTGMACAANLGYAEDISVDCVSSGKGKTTCYVYDWDAKKVEGIWDCKKHKNGTWSCVQARTGAHMPPGKVPAALTDAVMAARRGKKSR
jgi:hypothetical protein